MATPAQIAANRRNAQKSTGPTSAEGKEKASQNRRNHGLCGRFRVIEGECEQQFDELLAAFRQAEQPADAVQDELVLKMAQHHWSAQRALRMEADSFQADELDEDEQEKGGHGFTLDTFRLNLSMRYYSMHDRAYRRASEELAARRKQRQLTEIGFERKRQAEAEAQRKSEKHVAAVKTADLKNQLLEIRVAKTFVAELGKIKASQPPQEREFEFSTALTGQ